MKGYLPIRSYIIEIETKEVCAPLEGTSCYKTFQNVLTKRILLNETKESCLKSIFLVTSDKEKIFFEKDSYSIKEDTTPILFYKTYNEALRKVI